MENKIISIAVLNSKKEILIEKRDEFQNSLILPFEKIDHFDAKNIISHIEGLSCKFKLLCSQPFSILDRDSRELFTNKETLKTEAYTGMVLFAELTEKNEEKLNKEVLYSNGRLLWLSLDDIINKSQFTSMTVFKTAFNLKHKLK